MVRGGWRARVGRPSDHPKEIKQPPPAHVQGRRPYPTPYRVLGSLSEAGKVVAAEMARGREVQIADGFAKHPRGQCIWLYNRPESDPEGRTITVYGHTPSAGLVYFREDGTFQ